MAWQGNRAWSGYALVGGTLLAGLVGLGQALPWYGRPVPGLLVDPDLAVSSLTFPTWEGSRQGLRFPDRVMSVEGHAIASGRTDGARRYDEAVSRAIDEGRQSLRLGVRSGGELRELDLQLTPIGPMMWWLYAGGMYLVGLLYLGASALAITVRPKGRLARTFAKAAVFFALFLFTLFDYHTSRQLVVFFEAAFAMVPFAALALALRLPTDASVLAKRPQLEHVLDGSGAVLAACLVLAHVLGMSTLGLRSVVSVIFGLGLLLSALIFGIRFHFSRGNDRLIMRSLFLAMVPGSVVVGVGALLVMLSVSHAAAAFCVVPAFALIPLSSTLAFVRHDLWESRALLSRVTTRLVITSASAAFAAGLGGGLTALATDTDLTHAITASSVGSVTASLLVLVTLMHADRSLFRSRIAYKPTVEQLSEELTAVTRREQVSTAVENTVRRWLPTDSICFVAQYPQMSEREEGGSDRLRVGYMQVPARFQGKEIGSLRVGPKKGGALYSDQDMDLLRTIANLAAVALAHADRYEEVELRRKQQAETWRTERAAVVETLAAEIAHEIRYPINFFRSLFKKNSSERILNSEDIEIGCEEIERLSGLVADLQRVARRPVVRTWVPVLDLVKKSEALLRDQLGERRFQLDVPKALRIRCDGDQVTQVLVNLMSNAADAGPKEGMGIRWQSLERGGQFVVWDSGAGFECEAAMLFVPLYTTKSTGTGLGLSIAHRIVRAHHWKIDVTRSGAETSFSIQIPEADIRFEEMAQDVAAEMRTGE